MTDGEKVQIKRPCGRRFTLITAKLTFKVIYYSITLNLQSLFSKPNIIFHKNVSISLDVSKGAAGKPEILYHNIQCYYDINLHISIEEIIVDNLAISSYVENGLYSSHFAVVSHLNTNIKK